MELIPLPSTIQTNKKGPHEAVITIEPCYPGYGITLGNALRRVLLSSMPGSAITSVTIKGAPHEFTSLPGVKEDVVELMLNLKQVRVRSHSDQPQEVTLHVKGEKVVTAKDIQTNQDVEVCNPEQHIATLTDKSSDFEMTFKIQNGRGYVPAEMQEKGNKELGTILLDAIYTPVKNVNFDIEHVRVGEITNFDKITLSISTDGSISPEEAFNTASQILVEHFTAFVQKEKDEEPAKKKSKKVSE